MQWWTRQQLTSKKPEVRRQAIERIAAEGGTQAVERLLPLIDDPDSQVAKAAVQALGKLKVVQALPDLQRVLRSVVADLREAAAVAITHIGDPQGVPILAQALRDPCAAVRWQAAKGLDTLGWHPKDQSDLAWREVALGDFSAAAQRGAPAIDPLLAALHDGSCGSRRNAVRALAETGDARVTHTLVGVLRDKDPTVRAAAVEAIGQQHDTRLLDPITMALKDRSSQVRVAAAGALAKLGHARAVEFLLPALKDSHWEVRKAVAESLATFQDPRAVETLASLLSDSDREVRAAAAKVLEVRGSESATGALILGLADEDNAVRQSCELALRRVSPTWERTEAALGVVPELKKALTHRSYWVRQAAADILGRITDLAADRFQFSALANSVNFRHQAAISVLLEALGDWDRDLRLAAAEALGRNWDSRTGPMLMKGVRDPDIWVQEACAQSLKEVGNQPPKFKLRLSPN